MSQNEEKKEMPSLAQQGRNLVDMMADIGADVINGREIFVTDLEQKRRYGICQACESFDHMRKRCRECGCFMKQKTAFSASECPLNKW
tara:strand:- start:483 stop:746 length:264 start_codon:yes stop_codon:yes gene_type:complete